MQHNGITWGIKHEECQAIYTEDRYDVNVHILVMNKSNTGNCRGPFLEGDSKTVNNDKKVYVINKCFCSPFQIAGWFLDVTTNETLFCPVVKYDVKSIRQSLAPQYPVWPRRLHPNILRELAEKLSDYWGWYHCIFKTRENLRWQENHLVVCLP